MATVDELFDALMRDRNKPAEISGENGLLTQLSRELLDRTMPAVLREQQVAKTIFY
jgi:hypothetical protein